MSKQEIMTNAELQSEISERLRAVREGESDAGAARTFYVGARTLLTSVKIDVDGAKQLGVPIFGRTKAFLGITD